MSSILHIISNYALAIYVTCTAGVLFYLRFLVQAQREERQSIFALEKETAATRSPQISDYCLCLLGDYDRNRTPRPVCSPTTKPPHSDTYPHAVRGDTAYAYTDADGDRCADGDAAPNAAATADNDTRPADPTAAARCQLSESGCDHYVTPHERSNSGYRSDPRDGQHCAFLFL